jgi:hypothetical protein
VTWPWVLDPGSTLYSLEGGDLTAHVLKFSSSRKGASVRFLVTFAAARRSHSAPIRLATRTNEVLGGEEPADSVCFVSLPVRLRLR